MDRETNHSTHPASPTAVSFFLDENNLILKLPGASSFLALKSSDIIVPYAAITTVRVQPAEAYSFNKGFFKIGYQGIQSAAATFYHISEGPEFHYYNNPKQTIAIDIDRSFNKTSFIKLKYEKIILEFDGDIEKVAVEIAMKAQAYWFLPAQVERNSLARAVSFVNSEGKNYSASQLENYYVDKKS